MISTRQEVIIDGIKYVPKQRSNSDCDCDIEIGKAYFFRTITYHALGRVKDIVQIKGNWFIKLADSSWVAESARWYDTLKTGELNEVEPFVDDHRVAIESIVDYTEWRHNLPRSQK